MADNTDMVVDCPACGKEMKKVYMKEQGIYLDVCLDGCGGIYFDNREYKKFDEKHEDISPLLEAFEGKTFKKVSESDTIICPICHQEMVKHIASAKYEIQIDDCYSCGGIFLDHSELDRIRSEYVNEQHRSADVLQKLDESIGSYLRERDVAHAGLKEKSFFRKHCSSLVKSFIMNSNYDIEKNQD